MCSGKKRRRIDNSLVNKTQKDYYNYINDSDLKELFNYIINGTMIISNCLGVECENNSFIKERRNK